MVRDLILRRGQWRRCRHRRHVWPKWRTCWRGQTYQGQCYRHNRSCFVSCDMDRFAAALVAQVKRDGWPRYKKSTGK